MKANVGNADRIVRFVLAIMLFSLALILDGNARWWALLGLIPLLTGAIGFCPLYVLFGFSSCPLEKP